MPAIEPMRAQHVVDQRQQAVMADLYRRQVDRGRQQDASVLPCPDLAAGLTQDPGAQGDDQAAGLGDGDELGRG
jgi:hypothetical protein